MQEERVSERGDRLRVPGIRMREAGAGDEEAAEEAATTPTRILLQPTSQLRRLRPIHAHT